MSAEPHCAVCSATCDSSGKCGNPVCNWDDRVIGRVASIAKYTEPLSTRIKDFKYSGRTGWAPIFGRLVHGWLNENADPNKIDLIVPNPGDPGRQHTEMIIAKASKDDVDERWAFDCEPWALSKQVATQQSAKGKWHAKREAAEAHADAIVVDTEFIRGKRIVIFDDVSTTLLQMEYVARRLMAEGAQSVNGLVLARVGFGS